MTGLDGEVTTTKAYSDWQTNTPINRIPILVEVFVKYPADIKQPQLPPHTASNLHAEPSLHITNSDLRQLPK